MTDYLKQLRPKSWLKNVFVFVPLVFALELTNFKKLGLALLAFLVFCLVSSAVYIFNDIRDIDKDRRHPQKCTRPIASGAISVKNAVVVMIVLLVLAFGTLVFTNVFTAAIVISYIIINILYTMFLKHYPVYDCFCIATGFILRVYAGAFATGLPVSEWLFLTIVAMSLFMAFGKRRGELLLLDEDDQRIVLKSYNLIFLNGMMFMCAGLSIVFYSLWAMFREMNMIYTVPIIVFIITKYILLLYNPQSHGDPTTLIFKSKTLLIACGLYALCTILLLY